MGEIAHYRESMLRPDDEARWAIDGRTMRVAGPWLKNEGRIEVVPADLLKGAVEALAEAVRAHTRAIHALSGRLDYPADERAATGERLGKLLVDLRGGQ